MITSYSRSRIKRNGSHASRPSYPTPITFYI